MLSEPSCVPATAGRGPLPSSSPEYQALLGARAGGWA